MWRAFFLGIGVYLMIAGAECLAVDRVFWRMAPEPPPTLMSLDETGRPEVEGLSPRSLGSLESLVHGGRGLPLLLHHPEADGRRQVSFVAALRGADRTLLHASREAACPPRRKVLRNYYTARIAVEKTCFSGKQPASARASASIPASRRGPGSRLSLDGRGRLLTMEIDINGSPLRDPCVAAPLVASHSQCGPANGRLRLPKSLGSAVGPGENGNERHDEDSRRHEDDDRCERSHDR